RKRRSQETGVKKTRQHAATGCALCARGLQGPATERNPHILTPDFCFRTLFRQEYNVIGGTMKTLSGFGLLLLSVSALPAQNRSGFVSLGGFGGVTRRAVPSVVQPGGTSAMPGVQRFTPNVVFPAGGAQQIGIPGTRLVRPNVFPNLRFRHFD